MDIPAARSLLLKIFIAFLVLTALIAIASVLSGQWGEVQLKTMATTFTISAASVCAMACAAFVEKRGVPAIGWIGGGANFLAAAMITSAVWMEHGEEVYWKTAVSFVVAGLGFAHGCLMNLPSLATAYRWTQTTLTLTVAILAAMLISAIWGEIDAEGYYRMVAVVSIVAVLFTLVIPILGKLSPAGGGEEAAAPEALPPALTLTAKGDGVYEDAAGARYRVERIER